MPSGDSITMGAQSTATGGYRVPLYRLVLENEKSMTFVGPSGAGPATVDGVPFPENHDGHSGYIIDTIDTRKGLLPLMEGNLEKFTPHIVLLMIGTNDINSQIDLPNAPARLANLIDLIITTAPDTLLVVAKLIPTRDDSLNTQVRDFNNALASIVNERAEGGDHILMVDMYNAFTVNPDYKSDWLYDGLHPNNAGYAVMADTWYDAIEEFLY
jgi:lysophospholipase L1-like esterase